MHVILYSIYYKNKFVHFHIGKIYLSIPIEEKSSNPNVMFYDDILKKILKYCGAQVELKNKEKKNTKNYEK